MMDFAVRYSRIEKGKLLTFEDEYSAFTLAAVAANEMVLAGDVADISIKKIDDYGYVTLCSYFSETEGWYPVTLAGKNEMNHVHANALLEAQKAGVINP